MRQYSEPLTFSTDYLDLLERMANFKFITHFHIITNFRLIIHFRFIDAPSYVTLLGSCISTQVVLAGLFSISWKLFDKHRMPFKTSS